MTYCELQVTTHFSFLRGASSPGDLFKAAVALGLPALGITDRNSVGGVVRAMVAAEELTAAGLPIRMIAGCRLDLVDGSSLLVWPEDRAAWSQLTRLLTLGKGRADAQKGEKGKCFLHWEDVAHHAEGLVGALVPGMTDHGDPTAMRWMADVFDDRGHVCLTHQRRPNDALRLYEIDAAARRFGLTSLATGDILYDVPAKRMLQDVVTAIREKCTIAELGYRRERSADRHLKGPAEMVRRFKAYPEALRATEAIAERCTFSLRELKEQYRYPDEVVISGRSPQDALEKMSRAALADMFPGGVPEAYAAQLEHELKLVRKMGYAPYFLTVNSIVRYARSQEILCQGRGAAANSIICFVLGVTSIDPVKHTLLFERFISEDRHEPPDIDVDFEHERREEVIQWIYETYGKRHAALTAVVSRFRTRGALREVGKVMGLSEDMTAALAGQVWGVSSGGLNDEHVDQLNLDRAAPRLALTLELVGQLVDTPRHLSQHPGGFVLAHGRLDDLVPIEPAAMADRRVVEWEKLDVEELGLMKVDILGLGMLGCMRRVFTLLADRKGISMDMSCETLQEDDELTYAMIQQADTLGVFQIESRAQLSLLPRLKPEEFYDLVIEVAIVRPGPIQGDMVHPYLRRREGKEKISYPNDALKKVLEKTKGVPLFQEQAMQVAIVGAGFTPSEADGLRRAMATFKATGGLGKYHKPLIDGMLAFDITLEFAERLGEQIKGFGSYGFPESHAASFAKIAYASCWMKAHHPDIYCAALLNAQPMGFYAPAQIVRDARAHGVEVRSVCINRSNWDTGVLDEPLSATRQRPDIFRGTDEDWLGQLPLRLGMRIVHGLAENDANAIIAARATGPFRSVEDVWRRSRVKPAALERRARADAFHDLGLDRRQALWAVKGLGQAPLDLLALADERRGTVTPEAIAAPVVLDPLPAGAEVVEACRATQLSLRNPPLRFLRGELGRRGIRPCGDLQTIKDSARVTVAGIILVRQRRGSADGLLFLTLEDETGIANGVLWKDRFEAHRRIVMSSAMVSITGHVQREGIVIHVVTERITDLTPLLRQVGDIDLPRLTSRGDGATHGHSPDRGDPEWKPKLRTDYHYRDPPRQGELIPIKSHDFH